MEIRKLNLMSKIITSILVLFFISCYKKPEPIEYGKDVCDLCKMNITDNKFAAEIITTKGKIYKFDSIECLFQFKQYALDTEEKIHSEWVNDFSNPRTFIDLRKAFFLHSEVFRSPMGLNVLSFSTQEKLNEILNQYGGHVMKYDEVMNLAVEE